MQSESSTDSVKEPDEETQSSSVVPEVQTEVTRFTEQAPTRYSEQAPTRYSERNGGISTSSTLGDKEKRKKLIMGSINKKIKLEKLRRNRRNKYNKLQRLLKKCQRIKFRRRPKNQERCKKVLKRRNLLNQHFNTDRKTSQNSEDTTPGYN